MKNAFLSLLALATIGIVSCSKEDSSAPVQIYLTDAPAAYDEVNVHIKEIRAKMSGDTSKWISLATKDTTVNLLDLQNGVTMLLAVDTLPASVLKEVRFILGSDNNTVVVGGVSYPLETPSAEHSGLKIKIDKKLGETMNTFVLDFVADESIKENNGTFKLEPVIKIKH